jgi:DNA polymerase
MIKYCKPRRKTKTNAAIFHHKPEDFDRIGVYGKNDLHTTRAVLHALRPLSKSERRLWAVDRTINERGVMVDVELCKAALLMADKIATRANEEIAELTGGKVTSTKQVAALVSWLQFRSSPAVKALDAATVDYFLSRDDIPQEVRRALELRKEGSNSSTAKFQALLSYASPADHRVRNLFQYHGATTGRWTGRGPQLQNLPRGTVKGEKIDQAIEAVRAGDLDTLTALGGTAGAALASIVRASLIAKPDHEFVGADYSAIEARVLLWLANDPGLDVYHRGGDIYCEFASNIYGRHITKSDTQERQLGKVAILGLGYGMGAAKFYDTANAWGIEIEEAMAKRTVDTYRNTYLMVRRLWYDVERAAKAAIEDFGVSQGCGFGRIQFRTGGNRLMCKLPSGRIISYPLACIKENRFGKPGIAFHAVATFGKGGRKWQEVDTYGGSLVQSCVQGIARDVMAGALVRLENSGRRPVMSVHDEAVCEVPTGSFSVEEMGAEMCKPEPWAPGLPLDFSGWIGPHFTK